MKKLEFITKHPEVDQQNIVCLHGYGANQFDLVPLADSLDPHHLWKWFFPNAPLNVMGMGRAWFPIDERELERCMLTGEFRNFSLHCPEGMKQAHDVLLHFLQSEQINPQNLVLCGFSQGAMMSMQLAFHLQIKVKGLILFSGNPVDLTQWETAIKHHHQDQPLKIFMSHGNADPLLSFSAAENFSHTLQEWGQECEFHSFKGGHEIPYPILQKAQNFLAKLT